MTQLTQSQLNIVPPKILPNKLKEAIAKLDGVIQGASAKSSLYSLVVSKLRRGDYTISNSREARLAIAALWQEENMLEDLGDNLKLLIGAMMDLSGTNLSKPLLRLFYAKFFALEKKRQDVIVGEAIKYCLNRYRCGTKFVCNIKNEPLILQANFTKILEKYANEKLIVLARSFGISVNDDFYEQLRLSRLLVHFNTIEFDKNYPKLFEETKLNKLRNARTTNYRNIGEEATSRLLLRCFEAKVSPCESWEEFILQSVGDPRSQVAHNSWSRIGDRLKDYFIQILSKGDLREFLESVSDGIGDSIYRYRKDFWIKYIDRVLNARLLICQRDLNRLKWSNAVVYERIMNNPSTYGKLSTGDKSYIYIDFGSIKVIEGTHSASIRFYHDMPEWFKNNKYDLYDRSDIQSDRIAHSGSNEYYWQSTARYVLRKYGIKE